MLNDDEIIIRCLTDKGMITPFLATQHNRLGVRRVPSYGLSSAGYDIRVDRYFKTFSPANVGPDFVIDPTNFDESCLVSSEGDYCIIPPHGYILASTIEMFNIPDDILGVCLGKSSLARCGLILNVTPAEPGWTGWLTLEIANATPLPARIYAGMGIGQMLFYKTSRVKRSYANRETGPGKYQNQPNRPVTAR